MTAIANMPTGMNSISPASHGAVCFCGGCSANKEARNAAIRFGNEISGPQRPNAGNIDTITAELDQDLARADKAHQIYSQLGTAIIGDVTRFGLQAGYHPATIVNAAKQLYAQQVQTRDTGVEALGQVRDTLKDLKMFG